MSAKSEIPTSESVLVRFFDEALSLEGRIVHVFGQRWKPLFRAIRTRAARIRFSDEEADAAFFIDPVSGDFVFYAGGFQAMRSAMLRLAGGDAESLGLLALGDVAYGLHEIFHPEQGLNKFSIVQDHKKVDSGLDEIGKLDHAADVHAVTLLAAVYSARAGELDRLGYLKTLRELSYVLNRAAPLAFGAPDGSLHKQKRRLMNWLVFARIDDALRAGMIADIEQHVAPLDSPLWMHFNVMTGDSVLWEQEPLHRVLGTARIRPRTLQRALEYRDHLDRGELLMPLWAILHRLRVSAQALAAKPKSESPGNQAS